jgi:hypothetical protein
MNCTPYQTGLTLICIPTENSTSQTIVDATKIKAQLINQNLNHFAQAEHTAMAHHLICKEMGTSRTSNFCDRVVTADLTHLPATPQAIFHQLHQPHPVKVDNIISFDDYKDALQKWKESTLTSPSSQHLGTTSVYLSTSAMKLMKPGRLSYNYTTQCSKSLNTAVINPTIGGKLRWR